MRKSEREGRVFVDWSQNDEHKSTVCVYSLRVFERPRVSTPLTWEEVETAVERDDPNSLVFETDQVLERVEKLGDLYDSVVTMKQTVPELAKV